MYIQFDPVPWAKNTNIYEVNLRQYSPEGSFNAFVRELPRLADMGVRILWFMPITPISMKMRQGTLGSYYACSSYTKTNPEFGSLADFRSLVISAHDLGMKVIIDWVANHTGWDHEWTISHPEYYKKNAAGDFYDGNGWADVIDLNFYDQSMRRELMSAMEFWVRECDIDGFRCDMGHLVPLDFWRDARRQVSALKPLFWLAETEHNNYQNAFDCSYAWSFMHLTENVVAGKAGINELRMLLGEYRRKRLPQSNYLFFTSNHDENSWNGTEYEKYGDGALCFAVLACMWDGLALIYSGQELPNKKRLKFFDKDPIEWNGQFALHHFYKSLFDLRLSFGESAVEIKMINTVGEQGILAFVRSGPGKQVVVVLNLSANTQTVEIKDESIYGEYRDIFGGEKKKAPSIEHFSMEPWNYMVWEKV